jgi:hypothetical protein
MPKGLSSLVSVMKDGGEFYRYYESERNVEIWTRNSEIFTVNFCMHLVLYSDTFTVQYQGHASNAIVYWIKDETDPRRILDALTACVIRLVSKSEETRMLAKAARGSVKAPPKNFARGHKRRHYPL